MRPLPALQTARLCLRPRTLADFDACIAMDRDPEVTRFVPGPWADPARHAAFLHDRMAACYPEGLGYWSIFAEAEPERFLGWVLLLPYGTEVEIGWRLIRAGWGRGHATEAARAVARHGLTSLGLPRIVAAIHPDNRPSMRVAERIGMIDEGTEADGSRLYALSAAHPPPP